MEADSPIEPPRAWEVFRLPSVRPFLASVFLSNLALIAQETALGKQVYDLSHQTIDLGWLGMIEFLPVFALVTVAGTIADRYERRNTVRLGFAVMAMAAGGLALLAGQKSTTVPMIFAVVLVYGIARAFANPSMRALPANVVDRATLPRLQALWSLSWQLSLIVGPALGGLLYAADPRYVFIFVAGALVASIITLSFVHTEQSLARSERVAGSRRFSEAVEGLRVVRTTPIIAGAITLDLFAVLFGGAVALLPVIAEKQLHVGAVGFGWLRAAGGIGAALVAGTLAIRPVRRHIGVVLFSVVAVFGAATIVLGATKTYVVAFIAMVVLSGADAVSVFIRSTLTPLVVPDALRGRVLAVEAVFIGASNELGAFESGVVGQWLGAPLAIVLGGIGTLVVVGVGSVVFPSLRRIDRFAELKPADTVTP
jgi:MFS family permease